MKVSWLCLFVVLWTVQGSLDPHLRKADKSKDKVPAPYRWQVMAGLVGMGILGVLSAAGSAYKLIGFMNEPAVGDIVVNGSLSQRYARGLIEFEAWLTESSTVGKPLDEWVSEKGLPLCSSADMCIRRGIRYQLHGSPELAAKFFSNANWLNSYNLLDFHHGEFTNGWGATGAVISGSGSIALQLTSAGDEWVQGFSEIYEEIKSVGLKTSDSSQWAALSGCYLTTSREESRECLGAVKAVMNPGVEGRVEELG